MDSPRASRARRLQRDELRDAGAGERQELVQALLGKRGLFGGALHLDEGARARHHHVHVHLGRGVLHVVEVEHGAAADHADADRGDRIADG